MSEAMAGIDQELVGTLAARLDAAALRRLGRSLAVYVVTAGDCGGCALEMAALRHQVAGLGVSLVGSPQEADVLLVTGVMTRSLVAPVQRALLQMGQPRWVVAVGDCAVDGGVFAGSPAVAGGVNAAVPVDVAVPGCAAGVSAVLGVLRSLVAVNA